MNSFQDFERFHLSFQKLLHFITDLLPFLRPVRKLEQLPVKLFFQTEVMNLLRNLSLSSENFESMVPLIWRCFFYSVRIYFLQHLHLFTYSLFIFQLHLCMSSFSQLYWVVQSLVFLKNMACFRLLVQMNVALQIKLPRCLDSYYFSRRSETKSFLYCRPQFQQSELSSSFVDFYFYSTLL